MNAKRRRTLARERANRERRRTAASEQLFELLMYGGLPDELRDQAHIRALRLTVMNEEVGEDPRMYARSPEELLCLEVVQPYVQEFRLKLAKLELQEPL